MKTFELQIQIYIRSNQGDSLSVGETITIVADDFLSIAKVLGQFHDLAQAIRAAKK